jgi:hypothetical protein
MRAYHQTVYEAVDALTHMNGVFLGCLPLEIRFGRQEFGKVLWIGGLDDTITERYSAPHKPPFFLGPRSNLHAHAQTSVAGVLRLGHGQVSRHSCIEAVRLDHLLSARGGPAGARHDAGRPHRQLYGHLPPLLIPLEPPLTPHAHTLSWMRRQAQGGLLPHSAHIPWLRVLVAHSALLSHPPQQQGPRLCPADLSASGRARLLTAGR